MGINLYSNKDMNDQQTNIVEAALAAGTALAKTPIDAKDNPSNVILVPNGYQVKALEEYIEKHLPAPRRLKANVSFASVESFVRYVNDFKEDATRIFAIVPSNNGAPSFVAVLDYHSAEGASWCEHRASYNCIFTEEWKRWMANDRRDLSQAAFATFLEDNQASVDVPSGAELLELITTLEGVNNISVAQAIKLNSNKARLVFEENVELKGKVGESATELPLIIKSKIQMFEGGIGYYFDNRLKFKVEARKITFRLEAVNIHLIIRDAVKDVVTMIESGIPGAEGQPPILVGTGIKPLFGTP